MPEELEQLTVLKTVASRLNQAEIPYMVTGSMALNFYAQPRMTRDIDIVVKIEPEDTDEIYNLFKEDFYIDKGGLLRAAKNRKLFNIIHKESVMKVDFIVRKDDDYHRKEFSRRRRVSFEGIKLSIVAPEDLILSKLLWVKESQSEFQLRDVGNLLEHVSSLNYTYLKRWAKRLDLVTLYEKALK